LAKEFLLVLAINGSVLFGATYQLPIWFFPDSPQGYPDTRSYVKMWHGDYGVNAVHRYRPVVPLAASQLHRITGRLFQSERRAMLLSFYFVNFAFMLTAGVLLYYVLKKLGFSLGVGLLGCALFLSSQTSAYTVGLPLVDAPYYWAIAVISVCYVTGSVRTLAVLCSVLVLTKETTVPFLLLPLLAKPFRSKWYGAGLAVGIGALFGFRSLMDSVTGPMPVEAGGTGSLTKIVGDQLIHFGGNVIHVFSARNMVVLFEGFSGLIILAVVGFVISRRGGGRRIPLFFQTMVPLALFYAFLSNNYGRMLFAAYIPIIAYALVAVESLNLNADDMGQDGLAGGQDRPHV